MFPCSNTPDSNEWVVIQLEEPAQRLAEHNTNQCNNVAVARLPAVRLRGGRLAGGAGWERRPEFV